jgi:hypothetical protein
VKALVLVVPEVADTVTVSRTPVWAKAPGLAMHIVVAREQTVNLLIELNMNPP